MADPEKQAAPEVEEIEALATTANVSMSVVLKRAGVAPTTWWRWRKGAFDPRQATLRKIRGVLDETIRAQDSAPGQDAAA